MEFRGRILAIDDEVNIRRLLTNELEQEGFKVITAETGEQGLALVEKERIDLALVDLRLPGMGGIEVIKNLRGMPFPPETIVITGHGDIEAAVQSMKLGVREFITKPFKLSELVRVVQQTMKEKQVPDSAGTSRPATVVHQGGGAVYCPSPAMQNVYQQIRRVAPTDATVWILGETGVGKDVIANEIHLHSRRKEKPYVVVDCGLLNGNLAESELYGHRRGAFSGASENKTGLVAAADGGTVFLDEIGNIDFELQKKLLRFLETKRYRRVGDISETPVDTRIILATNMPLADAARKGTFRADLLYRLDVVCIRIPPLRNRPEDIPVLVEHFLKPNSELTHSPVRISSEVMDVLTKYPWPGNVRELRSVIFKTIILASSSIIKPEDLPCLVASQDSTTEQFSRSLSDVEKDHIVQVLQQLGGNQSKAAQVLGINRRTLYNKIRRYDIFA
jgi:DNA-binding NtrC family response regulator